MRTKPIPPRHNKTIWYLSRARNPKALFIVLKFIIKRYLRMLGLRMTRDYDALLGAEKTLNITKRLILEYHSDELRDRCESLLTGRCFKRINEIPEHRFYVSTVIA